MKFWEIVQIVAQRTRLNRSIFHSLFHSIWTSAMKDRENLIIQNLLAGVTWNWADESEFRCCEDISKRKA